MLDSQLAANLRGRFDSQLGDLVPAGTAVALVTWPPSNGNVGDHMIPLGAVSSLRRLGIDLVYTADAGSYDPRALRAAIGPDGVILLSGGGNFGDRWPDANQVRERVLLDFPGTRTVGFSQTLEGFSDPRAGERAAAIIAAHANLHLLWRDEVSLGMAQEMFDSAGVEHELAPDCAFGLDHVPSPSPKDQAPQVWLTRTDNERSGERLLPPGSEPAVLTDWIESPSNFRRSPRGRLRRTATRGVGIGSRTPAIAGRLGREMTRVRVEISWERVRAGVELLGRGEVLVTDRLHAHILSLLLGKPHVLVDTGYGKIDRFVSTWTEDAPDFRRAGNAEEAAEAARELSAAPSAR